MSPPKDLIRLQQMLEYARDASELIQEKSRHDLDADRPLGPALVQLLEMMGAAADRVSPEYQAAYPSIPWTQIISLPNRLIHGYDTVDLDILWKVMDQAVPGLAAELESIVLRASAT